FGLRYTRSTTSRTPGSDDVSRLHRKAAMPEVAPILIDGAWGPCRASATRELRNPTTLDPVGSVPECGTEDVAAAVEAAAGAQPAWWRGPRVEKAPSLREGAA